MTQTPQSKSVKVDFGSDSEAPEQPDVGIAITLRAKTKPATFAAGQAVLLHGSYNADIPLIRLCREGLAASILVTLLRTDRPWGATLRLATPQAIVERPAPPQDSKDRPHYREGGQFKVDLVKFFDIPSEPGKYQVEAILGRYHPERLDFEVR